MFVYAGDTHPHQAQKPKKIDIKYTLSNMEAVNAIGRRKAAVARVFLTEGTGKIVINKRDMEHYFPSSILQFIVKQPLEASSRCWTSTIYGSTCKGVATRGKRKQPG
jgi:hypothetical protein